MNNNFKSILYKSKYYSISYKLNFILKAKLFKKENRWYKNNNLVPSLSNHFCDILQTQDKFILDMIIYVNIESYMTRIYYVYYGKLHRDNGPAVIEYNKNYCVREIQYYQHGKLHRDNGPGEITCYPNNQIASIAYYQHGKLHRDNGPASIEYYENGNLMSESYFQDNNLHRIDAPACILYDEDGNIELEEYYLDDIEV